MKLARSNGGDVSDDSGLILIARERHRQVDDEGWSAQHDFRHLHDELVLAAVQYALPMGRRLMDSDPSRGADVPVDWPWDNASWKPTPEDRVRELAKAGSLIAAEIDRLVMARG